MSNDEPEPLEGPLSTLFAEERGRASAPAGAKERALRRLAAVIPGPGGPDGHGDGGVGGSPAAGGAAGSVSALARALPLLGAFLVGGAAGAGVLSAVRAPRTVFVDRIAQAPSASPSAVGPETALALSPTTITPSAAPSVAVAAGSARASSEARAGALAREREVLDVARTALGRGDGAHALDAVNRHAMEFPHGQMAEEREAIGVQALSKLGRADEAAARGARFRKRYPNSVMTPVIDAALGATPSASTPAK